MTAKGIQRWPQVLKIGFSALLDVTDQVNFFHCKTRTFKAIPGKPGSGQVNAQKKENSLIQPKRISLSHVLHPCCGANQNSCETKNRAWAQLQKARQYSMRWQIDSVRGGKYFQMLQL
jgi:hypothetical protein